ncbi:MAG: FGGY family carbohydrate kinase [Nitrososphaeria archaeon]|nr:FGGY family carbohydrate kinase [Nitrososphaeria archaeon]
MLLPTYFNRLIILSLDLGTSGCKGYMISSEGKILSSAKVGYKTYFGPGNVVEQNPSDWLAASIKCLKILCKNSDLRKDVAGLCVDATVGTLVPIERWGVSSVDRVPMYSDMRALDETEFVRERFGESFLYERTGNPLTPVPTLLKMMWIKRNMNKVYERTRKFIFHKDFVVENLIDESEPFTDYSDASATMAYDIRKKEWIDDVLEETGIASDKMVNVKESTEIVGDLRRDIAEELGIKRVPITVGAGDCAATLYGAGAISDATGDIYIGTAPEVDLTLEELRLDPKCRVPVRCHVLKSQWYSSATTLSGYSVGWFLDNFSNNLGIKNVSNPIDFLNEKCASIPPGSGGLIYLPYIIGERCPLMDPSARAAFIGLDINHGIEHIYRSVLEGIGFALRENYEVYVKDMGIRIDYLAFCGGGAENRLLRKIIVSNLKFDGLLLENPIDCAALGNVMLFLKSIGFFKDFRQARAVIVKSVGKEVSDRMLEKIYDEIYQIYRDSYSRLKDIFSKLRKYRV